MRVESPFLELAWKAIFGEIKKDLKREVAKRLVEEIKAGTDINLGTNLVETEVERNLGGKWLGIRTENFFQIVDWKISVRLGIKIERRFQLRVTNDIYRELVGVDGERRSWQDRIERQVRENLG